MKAENEVVVDREAFCKAVGMLGRGRTARIKDTRLYAEAGGFVVDTPVARTVLTAVGSWSQQVSLDAALLKRLAAKIPADEKVTIVYAAGRLAIGSFYAVARPLPTA